MVRGFLIVACICLAACSGPFMVFPGGAIAGDTAPYDLNAVDPQVSVLQLETNPADPYSVNLGFFRIGEDIYIDPAEERRWYQHIKADPRVRIRFDGSTVVHEMQTEVVTDAAVLSQFEADRIVLRLVPRKS